MKTNQRASISNDEIMKYRIRKEEAPKGSVRIKESLNGFKKNTNHASKVTEGKLKGTFKLKHESLILAQDERWRRA